MEIGMSKSRIVYIRDPEKNYQFVAYAKVELRPGSKYPYSFELIEGPFKKVIGTYRLVE
jgi:hypothetical protein